MNIAGQMDVISLYANVAGSASRVVFCEGPSSRPKDWGRFASTSYFPSSNPDCARGYSSDRVRHLVDSIIDFDLEPGISQLQRPTRCFSSLGNAEFCLEVAVDDRREPFGGRPVGSYCFLRLWLVY